jgi:hypothetical protein
MGNTTSSSTFECEGGEDINRNYVLKINIYFDLNIQFLAKLILLLFLADISMSSISHSNTQNDSSSSNGNFEPRNALETADLENPDKLNKYFDWVWIKSLDEDNSKNLEKFYSITSKITGVGKVVINSEPLLKYEKLFSERLKISKFLPFMLNILSKTSNEATLSYFSISSTELEELISNCQHLDKLNFNNWAIYVNQDFKIKDYYSRSELKTLSLKNCLIKCQEDPELALSILTTAISNSNIKNSLSEFWTPLNISKQTAIQHFSKKFSDVPLIF